MDAVIFPETGKVQEYRHIMKGIDNPKWSNAMANGIGGLFQGIRDIEGMDIRFFIHQHETLQEIKVTYCSILFSIRPQKKHTHRVHKMVCGDKLTYSRPVFTPTTDLTTANLYCNIVQSKLDTKYGY